MSIGLFQILIIALVILVLFGRGRISDTLGDIGKGVRSFRRNLESEDPALPPKGRFEAAVQEAEAAAEPRPAAD